MSHPIVLDEQRLLEGVATLLAEVPYDLPPSEKEIVEDLLRLREEMPEAKEEDRGALMDQYNARLALLEQLREARQRPQVDPDSPYFAHLRLREGATERDLFLGKATRIDRGIRIVDWRNAPVSRIFYQYQQGDEYEEELGGRTVEGEVVARRTVTIHRGELERVDAPEGTFVREQGRDREATWTVRSRESLRLAGGAGAALQYHPGQGSHRRLGTGLDGSRRRADKRLPDIAGLIDPDQFALIIRPKAGFVVIRGTAGSGKTTVALHRIAWLAYDDRSVNTARTLFLVFSPALRDYVANVLPALGVNRAQIRTFHEWSHQRRREHFPMLPRRGGPRDDTPAVVLKLKAHPMLLRALEIHAARHGGPKTAEQALDDWWSVLTDEALLQEVDGAGGGRSFTDPEIRKVVNWMRDRSEELQTWLYERDELVEKLATPQLDPEDDALLLRAYQLRVGPLRHQRSKRPLRYRHVAVDEVQDFSPLDVRILLDCLDNHQSITLAGDTQQHVMKEAGFTSWAGFFAHLGVQGQQVDTLKISYRCTREVVTFAMGLLGDLREDDGLPMVTRTGPAVELFRFTDHGAAVAFLADALKELLHEEPMASVGVLTAGRDLSRTYHAGLTTSEVPRVRLVEDQSFSFQPGIEVTEVEQVKGLEFDYVVLVEVSAARYPDTPSARRVLHVGATRAVHQLWMTTVGTASPVVREALAEAAGHTG